MPTVQLMKGRTGAELEVNTSEEPSFLSLWLKLLKIINKRERKLISSSIKLQKTYLPVSFSEFFVMSTEGIKYECKKIFMTGSMMQLYLTLNSM